MGYFYFFAALLFSFHLQAQDLQSLEWVDDGSVDFSALDFQPDNVKYSGLQGSFRIALTFDDGPSSTTPALLDLLKEEGVPATFFLVGQNAKNNREILRRMNEDGYIIANHSKTHPQLNDKYVKNPAALIDQIAFTHRVTKPFFQPTQRWYFRAPYGLWRKQHAKVLNADQELRKYIGPIYWDIGGNTVQSNKGALLASADWDCWRRGWSADRCADGYISEARRRQGGVVLMHDLNPKTIGLVRSFIRSLKAEGYKFITLDEIKAYDDLEI